LRRVDAELHWEQKAGGVMLLAIALLAFFLGVYPQPLLTLVQHAVMAVAATPQKTAPHGAVVLSALPHLRAASHDLSKSA
ncbi:MAG: hypothetical protein U1C13_05640, partial [Pseudomonas sp.]|nr:hypothetical protein [Pseudomonas sp.]